LSAKIVANAESRPKKLELCHLTLRYPNALRWAKRRN
jgi:hypothetical protein